MSRAVLLGVLALGASACVFPDDDKDCSRDPVIADPSGLHRGYIVDALDLPSTSREVQDLGQDVDYWHEYSSVDNQLGQVIAMFTGFGYDVDAEANAEIASGALLHLLDLQASDLIDDRAVGMRIGLGTDLDADPTDNFSGTEPFSYDPVRGSGYATGVITDGRLDLRVGTARIAVAFPGLDEPFVLPLIETRVVGTVTDGAITGKIAGAVPAEFIDETLAPVLYEGMSRILERDCPEGACAPDSPGELILWALDANDDTVLTYEEFRAAPIVSGVLSPDLDLRLPGGAPQDACATEDFAGFDALSVGVGFHAVPAQVR